jgi:hypothetical protein
MEMSVVLRLPRMTALWRETHVKINVVMCIAGWTCQKDEV